MGIANISSFCSLQGSGCTLSPCAAAAAGPSPSWVLLLPGPRDALGTTVPQGGGIAPLRVHMERPALTTRLFGSAQDLAHRGGQGSGRGDCQPRPPWGGFSASKAGGSAQPRRRQCSGPRSLATLVLAMETLVANRRVQ